MTKSHEVIVVIRRKTLDIREVEIRHKTRWVVDEASMGTRAHSIATQRGITIITMTNTIGIMLKMKGMTTLMISIIRVMIGQIKANTNNHIKWDSAEAAIRSMMTVTRDTMIGETTTMMVMKKMAVVMVGNNAKMEGIKAADIKSMLMAHQRRGLQRSTNHKPAIGQKVRVKSRSSNGATKPRVPSNPAMTAEQLRAKLVAATEEQHI